MQIVYIIYLYRISTKIKSFLRSLLHWTKCSIISFLNKLTIHKVKQTSQLEKSLFKYYIHMTNRQPSINRRQNRVKLTHSKLIKAKRDKIDKIIRTYYNNYNPPPSPNTTDPQTTTAINCI